MELYQGKSVRQPSKQTFKVLFGYRSQLFNSSNMEIYLKYTSRKIGQNYSNFNWNVEIVDRDESFEIIGWLICMAWLKLKLNIIQYPTVAHKIFI